MALGTAIVALSSPTQGFEALAPVSMTAPWQTVIDAAGMDLQDAATITNPTTQITSRTRHILQRRAKGTNLILRMKYDSTLTGITSPIVKVFGRCGTDIWQLLYSRAGNIVETISVDTTNDARDGTFSYTTPSFAVHAWDCLGCEEVIVGIQTALAGSTGLTITATLQAKFI